MSSKLKKVKPRSSFAEMEDEVTEFWQENKIFEKSVEQRDLEDTYSFVDGPPFVSGLPHYGHLLTSIAKDVVPRYWTMKGRRVRRVFGWDCHGLPVEAKVNKKLDIHTRAQVDEEIGVDNYIKECKKYVNQNIADWRWYIEKIGRWVDMDNAYRTMDPEFNESVIWAFKQIWDKDYVYKGKRVSLYSTDTMTPVSEFEVAMDPDNYQDVEDLSVFVKFEMKYHKTGRGCGVVIENEKDEVLIIKRDEVGREKTYGIIGGKLEPGENIDETIERECKEEIGVVPDDIEIVGESLDVFEGRLFHTTHVKARLSSDTELKLCDDIAEAEWVSKDEIPWDNMHIPTKNGLEDVLGLREFSDIEREKPPIYIVAWTTTPWTLPSNFGLAVNPKFDYLLVKSDGEYLVVAKDRVEEVFEEVAYEVVDKFSGKEFEGIEYEPLFDFFVEDSTENDFHIYLYDQVSNEEGSGVLHMAPAFGEEDFNLGKKFGLSFKKDIDEEGHMIVGDWKGDYIRDASEDITENLDKKGNLLKSEMYKHRLPFYRGDNPLIYMAQDAYFIDIQRIKDRMLELNEDVRWVPKHYGDKRFVDVVKTAPDWCISRNRYWGTVMPLWKSKDGDQIVVGGIEDLMKYTDQVEKGDDGKYYFLKGDGDKELFTFHRDICDKIVLQKDGKDYKRVEEILDVWLDSGSVPFAEHHYPFEHEEEFKYAFPADFIVEYAPQLRAWFNVLFRVSTMIYDKAPFKNVVCHGVIAGDDGRKMSKSFNNYPDPKEVLETKGGEAVRLYLMGLPVMVGERAAWSDEVLDEHVKATLIPLWNTYRYLTIYAERHNWTPEKVEYATDNVLDRWIKTYMDNASLEYSRAMEEYNLPAAVKVIRPSVEAISTWWIRRSRDRFAKGDLDALKTLHAVLVQFAKTFAPQLAFINEKIYRGCMTEAGVEGAKESVHLEDYPAVKEDEVDLDLLEEMKVVRKVCSLGLNIRDKEQLKLRQPLAKAYVQVENEELKDLVKEELNVKAIENVDDPKKYEDDNVLVVEENNVSVAIDIELTEELKNEGLLNDLSRQIQKLRKKSGCKLGEQVKILYSTDGGLAELIDEYKDSLEKDLYVDLEVAEELDVDAVNVGDNEIKLEIG